jgi:4-hydroxy-2-oxoheptanedioate aldolase
VRVPDLSPGHIKHALDAGAYGILAPMITTVDEVVAFVRGCRYPPQGNRGVYGGTAGTATFQAPFPEYYDGANGQVLIAVQIETRPALEAADEIAAVEGVDVLFVGPNDLQAALGQKPRYDSSDPELLAAYKRVVSACQEHGKAAGILTASPEAARQRMAEGFRFVGMGNDMAYMVNGAKAALSVVK